VTAIVGLRGWLAAAASEIELVRRSPRYGGAARRGPVSLVYEGYLLDDARGGDATAERLLERYLAHGAGFVRSLDGSFQIAISEPGRAQLWSDALGSRRSFLAPHAGGIALAPSASALRRALGHPAIDRANVVQFLLSGRFFAGECALEGIAQLGPAEHLTVDRAGVARTRWGRYDVQPDAAHRPVEGDALVALEAAIDRAVLAAFHHASRPAVLLSGGYDSRYILNVLLRHGVASPALRSVLWGVDMTRPGSDGHAAAALARHAGFEHIEIERDLDEIPSHIDQLLEAQSGMTELAVAHADELAICERLAAHDRVDALIRGDEAFGASGPGPVDLADARARGAMRGATDADAIERWFVAGDRAEFAAAHTARLDRALAEYPIEPRALCSALYVRERLPAFTHHLTAHKLPALEIYNPLLANEVVALYAALPSECRIDKALFKRSYHRRFDDADRVAMASGGNALDWTHYIQRSGAVQSRLRRGLERLPAPLSAEFFVSQLDAVIRGQPAAATRAGPRSPPTATQLVLRGAVLSWWLAEPAPSAAGARREP
jgi:asparagine synthetase B (glutamine-hydrolysing)